MDPLIHARILMLDTDPRDRERRGDLGWSALPSAPVAPVRRRGGAVRHRLAGVLRSVADRIDVRRPVGRVATGTGRGAGVA